MTTGNMTQADFENQVWPLREKLYRIAMYMLHDEDRAGDAVQHIMAKVWEKRNELNKVRNMEAFLVTSIKNYCLDSLKAARKEVLNGDEALMQYAGYETPDYTTEVSNSILVMQIKKIVESLPEKQRQVMLLRDLEGMDMEEIEEITGLKQGAIRVNLSRARCTVRDKLKVKGTGITHNIYGTK